MDPVEQTCYDQEQVDSAFGSEAFESELGQIASLQTRKEDSKADTLLEDEDSMRVPRDLQSCERVEFNATHLIRQPSMSDQADDGFMSREMESLTFGEEECELSGNSPRSHLAMKIFSCDEDGDTWLHMAVIHKMEDVALQMLAFTPDPDTLNISNDLRQTALHLAAYTGQTLVARRLVAMGALLDTRDRHGNTALHIACHQGDIRMVRALTRPLDVQEIKHGPCSHRVPFQKIPQPPDLRNYEGYSCLHLAAFGGHLEVMVHLLGRHFGSDVNARDGRSGRTILHHAVESHNIPTLALLFHLPAVDWNVKTFDANTPWTLAFGRGHFDIAEALVCKGAGVAMGRPLTDSGSSDDSTDDSSSDRDCTDSS